MGRDPVDLLIFDLGGVLIDFSGINDLQHLLRIPISVNDIRSRWLDCPTIRDFELGRINQTEFGERFSTEWNLRCSADEFLAEFARWNRRPLPGAIELLRELQPSFRLSCLSNSNELHWAANSEMGLFGFFDGAFSSHILGQYKPEAEAYLGVANSLGIDPGRCAFFDDNQVNVDGALRVGMQARLVQGVEGLRRELVSIRPAAA